MMVMVVSAVVNSAAQGRAFGKGSEVWVVIRVMMSLILILPAGSHTYNFAQILAINCIKVGSRGATYAWEGNQDVGQGVSSSPGLGRPSMAHTRPGASSVVKRVRRSSPPKQQFVG